MKSEEMSPIKLKVIPKTTLWGGRVLKKYFSIETFGNRVGQTQSVICKENNSNYIEDGYYKGKRLYDLWINQPELFQSSKPVFPFIIGLVAPIDDLSIQVHPTKVYAKKNKLTGSKNEAWLFIKAAPKAKMIYGQKSKNKKELLQAIKQDKLLDYVKYKSVKENDFVYIPAGQLHALGKDVIVYEVQEATDITYRFYDYNRLDENGASRDLHINEAMECLNLCDYNQDLKYKIVNLSGGQMITYIKNESFAIRRIIVNGSVSFVGKKYYLATIIKGIGKINNVNVKKGDSYLLPATIKEYKLDGDMDVMLTSEN